METESERQQSLISGLSNSYSRDTGRLAFERNHNTYSTFDKLDIKITATFLPTSKETPQ